MGEVAVHCPACRHENRTGAKFCEECGTSLGDGAESSPSERSLPAVIGGRYTPRSLLGEGARKRVYLARDERLGRDVAVAVIRTDGLDADGRARAAREAQAMARLGDHAHIVTVHDVGEDGGSVFMVSQHMPGGSLADRLDGAPERRLPVREAVRVGEQVARALAHAHSHDIVHRDVKPANVWIDADGNCLLGDFGLAVPLDVSRMTEEGIVVGTVAYLAPEQAMGRPPDPRADLYSLGALVYECLCGRPPFLGEDAVSVISQHLNTAPVAPSWHAAEVPPPLDALVLRLLAKDPAERPVTASDVAAELARLRETWDSNEAIPAAAEARPHLRGEWGRFVGRPDELGRLRDAFDEALAARTRMSMVVGEPGIGKTRLVEELGTYASVRGARVCWGRCFEGEVGVPYLPFVEALRSHVRAIPDAVFLAGSAQGVAELATMVPEIRERLPHLPVLTPLEGDAQRLRLFEGVASFLRSATRVEPLVLVLDDLHWADQATLMLLRHLVHTLTDARLLVVGVYRDIDLDRTHPLVGLVADLRRRRGYDRVLLRGLDREEVKALIEAISAQDAPGDFVDAVFSTTEGNPFFVQEILRHLVERGVIRREAGHWVAAAAELEQHLPEGIRDVIGRRLDSLSVAGNELLAVVSAMPGGFTLDVAAAVAGIEEEQALDALDEALGAQLVREVRDRPGTYEFSHALIRQTLYRELNTPRRVRLHRQITAAIENLARVLDDHLPELAHHATEAAPGGDVAKAVDYARRAAAQATEQAAYDDAVRYHEMALHSFDHDPGGDDEEHLRLLMDLGEACTRAGDAPRREAVCRSALPVARRLGDPELLARLAITRLGTLGPVEHVDLDVVAALDEAADLLRRAGPSSRRMALLAEVLARTSGYINNRLPERADVLAAEALEVARRAGDDRSLAVALLYSTQTFALDRDEHLARLAEASVLAEHLDEPELLMNVKSAIMTGALIWVDRPAYDDALAAYAAIATETRSPNHLVLSAIDHAGQAVVHGRFRDADVQFRAALRQARPLGDPSHRAQVSVAMVPVHRELRGLAGLEDAARGTASAWPDAVVFRAYLAWVLAEAGHRDEARELVDGLVFRDADELRLGFLRRFSMAAVSEAVAVLGHADAAPALYGWLERELDFGEMVIVGPSAFFGAVQRYLGLLVQVLGDADAAVRHHDAAVEVHGRMGAEGWAARSRLDLARARLARDGDGDADAAARLVGAAVATAHRLDMPKLLEEAMALKLELQGVSPHSSPAQSIDAVSAAVTAARPDLADHAGSDGRVVICFSDIVGYTSMTDRLGDRTTHEVLRLHNEILRRELRAAAGVEVKSEGDGFMLVFPDARRALQFAAGFQRALRNREWPEDVGPVQVRMGLHQGEVIRDADDFFGRTVIVGARVAAQAGPGEVLATETVRAGAGEGFSFGARRDLELKGLRGTHAVWPLVP